MKKTVRKHARRQVGGKRLGVDDEKLAEELYELCKNRQGAWAKEHGFTRAYINAVCNGRMPISEKIVDLLGYEIVKTLIKKPK